MKIPCDWKIKPNRRGSRGVLEIPFVVEDKKVQALLRSKNATNAALRLFIADVLSQAKRQHAIELSA